MKEFFKNHISDVTILSSLVLVSVVTIVLISATGKILVLEVDGLSGHEEDSDGNFKEHHMSGGKFKFYAE